MQPRGRERDEGLTERASEIERLLRPEFIGKIHTPR